MRLLGSNEIEDLDTKSLELEIIGSARYLASLTKSPFSSYHLIWKKFLK